MILFLEMRSFVAYNGDNALKGLWFHESNAAKSDEKSSPSRNKKQPADVIAVNDFTFEIPDGVLLGCSALRAAAKSTTLNLFPDCRSLPPAVSSLETTTLPTCLRRTGAWGWCSRIMPCIPI